MPLLEFNKVSYLLLFRGSFANEDVLLHKLMVHVVMMTTNLLPKKWPQTQKKKKNICHFILSYLFFTYFISSQDCSIVVVFSFSSHAYLSNSTQFSDLFVTSKTEFFNSPIHEFKVLQNVF